MSSPLSSTKWSSTLTPELMMTLTEEGLNPAQPSFPSSSSPPYTCSGALNLSPTETNLGFCLLGPSHCCSPPLLSRPISSLSKPMKNPVGLSLLLLRPRCAFNSILASPILMKSVSFQEGRRRFPTMLMMDLAWTSHSFSRFLADSLVRLVSTPSLISKCVGLFPLSPRIDFPRFDNDKLLSSESLLVPLIFGLAGQEFHASRVLMSLRWVDRFYCRGQMTCVYRTTLPVVPCPNLCQLPKSLKKNGIMITSLRSSGYRYFCDFPPPLHPIFKFTQLLLSNIKDWFYQSKRLMKNGIMIPSPRNGDYRRFLTFFYPLPLIFELKIVPEEIYIIQDMLLLVPMPLLRFVSTNQEAKDFFSTSQYLLIMTISKFLDLIAEVSMTHFEVACGKLLDCFCLRSSIAYPLFLPLYALKIIASFFIFEDFVNFAHYGMD